jgi:hexosaminidase
MPVFLQSCVLVIICLTIGCTPAEPTDLTKAALIPYPVSVLANGERFELNAATVIQIEESQKALADLAVYLQNSVKQATGLLLAIEKTTGKARKNTIVLSFSDKLIDSLGVPAYELLIDEDRVNISANEPRGCFYAIQTFRQLIPFTGKEESWEIAGGTIQDYPAYAYRGMMLDVARHFFPVEDIKRLIDLIASYKINYLHLHLADDQGWRIEIKSWPLLTQKGGSTQVGGGPGGFYSQKEYREIVAYAQAQFITIVPEIDMPGHTNAALASYPVLNCNNISPDLYTGTEVGFSTLCTSKEIVYDFVDDVVREIAAITPGPYFHMGGDESHVTALEDYIPFVERVQMMVTKYGKQLMGWDEVSHARLANDAIVQYWSDAENALRGVAQGARVLLSPAHKVYLDMQYDSTTHLGLHWAAYIEVDSAYLWSPETLVPGLNKENILGIESPLWSETITNIDEIEYMVFPRLTAHAELAWSPAGARNWEHYRQRMQVDGQRLDALDVDFYRSALIDWGEQQEGKE